jgi:hypothetical protein
MDFYNRINRYKNNEINMSFAISLLIVSFIFESYLLQCLLNWFVLDTINQIDYYKAMGINLVIMLIRKTFSTTFYMEFKKQGNSVSVNLIYNNSAFVISLFILAVIIKHFAY